MHTSPSDPIPSAVAALEVRGLSKIYGRGTSATCALAGVDLTFQPGTFTAVMGPSGSGKSSLLHCAAGLDRPTDGRVLINGEDITDWDERRLTKLRRDHLGFVFQSFHLMPYLTAEQNVDLPRRLAGTRPSKRATRELLARLGLGDKVKSLPAVLSGGQQQRVAIARALAGRPAVILADEPTGALDSRTARDVLGLLRSGVDGGIDGNRRTVLMVTHDPVAASFADRVVFLVDGRVIGTMHTPTVEAVAASMAHLSDDDRVVAPCLAGVVS